VAHGGRAVLHRLAAERPPSTGIDAALSIPHEAIGSVRIGTSPDDQLGGQPTVVVEVADGEPILIRPIGTGRLEIDTLARRLSAAAKSPRPPTAAV
jgi:hypothetical protein